MENLKDKVALVFSASGEIAGAVARSFAQHGAKGYVTAINLNAVEFLDKEIEANGGRTEAGKVDALNKTEIDSYLQQSPISQINMKIILTALLLLITGAVSAQSKQEAQILALSKTIFRWETTNQLDSLANIFDQKFMVVSGTGEIQKRDQYLTTLRSGNFVHNNIDVEDNAATVENSTATVVGKGKFTVTISGNKVTLPLSYIEVFTKIRNSWKLLALHFGVLPN
jgi:NAD(P)-dependent dehydrogenase (short-subunit alcohol dehydrogenase family)